MQEIPSRTQEAIFISERIQRKSLQGKSQIPIINLDFSGKYLRNIAKCEPLESRGALGAEEAEEHRNSGDSASQKG